jgi:hypothetical protein
MTKIGPSYASLLVTWGITVSIESFINNEMPRTAPNVTVGMCREKTCLLSKCYFAIADYERAIEVLDGDEAYYISVITMPSGSLRSATELLMTRRERNSIGI